MSTSSSNQHANALTGTGNGATDRAELHRQQCLRRIAKLKEEIRTVKESYNSVSPAYSLPPEMLSTIFLATVALSREDVDDDDELHCRELENLQWLGVTQVCQKWRNVALNCAPLWSTLCLINPQITSLMLERSKQAPLTISFSSDREDRPPAYSEALRKALSQVHRLYSVTFCQHLTQAGRRGAVPIRDSLASWTGEAPLLENLALTGDDGLPTPFLAGGAPVLKRLFIDQIPCTPSLREFRAPNLTSLYIGGYNWKRHILDAPPPKPEDLLGALSQFHRLEKLVLYEALPAAVDMVVYNSTHPRLSLPNLRETRLVDIMGDIAGFLAACLLPPSTVMHVHTDPLESFESFDLMGPLLHEACRRSRTRTSGATRFKIHKFAITTYLHQPTYWRCWLLHEERPEYREGDRPDFAFSIKDSISGLPLLPPALSRFFYDALDFSALSILKVFKIPGFKVADWRAVFGQLPLLGTVELGKGDTALLRALGGDGDEVEAPAAPLSCFPALSTLVVSSKAAESGPAWGEEDLEAIAQVLAARSRAGLPIRKVVLEGGEPLEETQNEFLRREAPETVVEWRE